MLFLVCPHSGKDGNVGGHVCHGHALSRRTNWHHAAQANQVRASACPTSGPGCWSGGHERAWGRGPSPTRVTLVPGRSPVNQNMFRISQNLFVEWNGSYYAEKSGPKGPFAHAILMRFRDHPKCAFPIVATSCVLSFGTPRTSCWKSRTSWPARSAATSSSRGESGGPPSLPWACRNGECCGWSSDGLSYPKRGGGWGFDIFLSRFIHILFTYLLAVPLRGFSTGFSWLWNRSWTRG